MTDTKQQPTAKISDFLSYLWGLFMCSIYAYCAERPAFERFLPRRWKIEYESCCLHFARANYEGGFVQVAALKSPTFKDGEAQLARAWVCRNLRKHIEPRLIVSFEAYERTYVVFCKLGPPLSPQLARGRGSMLYKSLTRNSLDIFNDNNFPS